MSHLEERTTVACALPQAALRIRHFFVEHGGADGDAAKLMLRLDVPVPGLKVGMTLQRAVVARIESHHLPADMGARYRVQWAPQIPGPFPLFSGELLVEGGSDYGSFSLVLSGDYTPPLGIVGKRFDLAVGNRVARATAHKLLLQMRDFIERDFDADEAREPHVATSRIAVGAGEV
ncbi:MAG: hypothetical protein IAI50_07170 [Candidatus Eremiobacteraeota bacterium]|nr:hypothetical protein [Candidatus Eremiobacteraeota bacterium]